MPSLSKIIKEFPPSIVTMTKVSMTVNGKAMSAETEGRTLLSTFLRDGLGLTGTHVGSEADAPKLASCDPEIRVMESLTRPKRLIMRGSDGKEYWWLVKGGEDLRQVTNLLPLNNL